MRSKKKFAKLLKLFLVGALTVVCLPLGNLKAENSLEEEDSAKIVKEALKIYFDEPVSQGSLIPGLAGAFETTEEDNRWQQLSLPIGNSYLGANIYGEVSKEHLTFNHKTLWNGGPSESRPNYNGGNIDTVGDQSMANYVKSVQDAFLNGQDTTGMCEKIIGVEDGYGAYQSFGDIYMDFKLDGKVENYRRELDLNTSIAKVDFSLEETNYHREYLASYPDNVIAMKVTADGVNKMNFDVSFPIDNDTSVALQKTIKTIVTNDKITVAGQMNDNQLKLNSQLKVYPVDGSVEVKGDTLTVKNATEVHIFVSANTDYRNEYPAYRTNETDEQLDNRIAKDINDAYNAGYEKVKENALSDYQEIFSRVELNLGQDIPNMATDKLLEAYKNGRASKTNRRALETLLFQYGRYLQIASSRNGDLPANLQGVWNNRVGDANRVPWGSDYHMNVNLQMNYWPTYVTNMQECASPLIDYVDSLREPGRVTAKTYFGVVSDENNPENGFTAHTQNTPFGWTCPGWQFSWGWSPAAVPWILQNCYEYFEYTGDLDYLKEKIYPMLKEEAKLYQQILKEDPETGRMVTVPAYSPEHGPYTAGNTYEQSLVWQLFKDATEAAEALGTDVELVTQWKELQNKLKPIEIGSDGQIKEWYFEDLLGSVPGSDREHRHMSHLLGLFPGDLISFDNEEYLNAAIVSLTDRGDDATGWGMGQRLNSWARVGDGNHAYDIIKAFFNKGAYPNLWDACAPFQIDGNFGYTAGVAEMLMQSNMGYINMLPALPDAWATGHVSGLVARGNFELSMDWSNSNLIEASVLSKNGQDCSIQYPNIAKATIKNQNGNIVNFNKDNNNKITFETKKGQTYTIEDIPEKPIKAPENAKVYSDGKATLITFNAIPAVSLYNVYRSKDGQTYQKIATVNTNSYTDTYQVGVKYKIAAVVNDGEGEITAPLTPIDIGNIEKMDDRDALITYIGNWDDWSDSGQYLGTEKYTYANGDTMEFYFSGTGLNIIGMTANDTHTYDLYIDDQKVASDVNTNSLETKRQQILSQTTDLTNGIHKVKLVVKQAKISLDAFEIIRDVEATGLTISSPNDTINLNNTNTMQMQAKYLPAGASGNGVIWKVENDLGLPSNIASINDEGLLTVNHMGSVTVCATDKENSNLIAKKIITVIKDITNTKYDDRDNLITYSNDWTTWDESKHENGTVTESIVKDSSFSFEFEGTGLALYFMKLESSGSYAGANIEVEIDGVSKGLFSTYSIGPGSKPKSKVFEDLTLSNGSHIVTVTVKDCPEEAPVGSKPKVSFDYYQVTSGNREEPLDYLSLAQEMIKFKATDLSKYFIETTTAYQNAFNQAKDKYEVALNQEEIASLTALLKTKREALIDKAKYKMPLNDLITTWNSKDLSIYEEAGVANLKRAIDLATAVYQNNNASKHEVDDVLTVLEEAIEALKLIGEAQVNKSALQIAIDLADKVTDKELENVVPAIVTEFKTALVNAKEVLVNGSATQAQVDTAFDRLAKAMWKLEFFKGDKTELQKLVTQINGLDETKYSEASWSAMVPVLEEAKKLLANQNAMEKEVQETYDKLIRAFLQLRLIPNKDLLESLINQAKALNAAKYTAKSWQAMQEELVKAKATLANGEADYASVEAAIAGLQIGINALETTVTLPEQPSVKEDAKESTKTGDLTNMNQVAAVMFLAGAAIVAFKRKKIEE